MSHDIEDHDEEYGCWYQFSSSYSFIYKGYNVSVAEKNKNNCNICKEYYISAYNLKTKKYIKIKNISDFRVDTLEPTITQIKQAIDIENNIER